MTTVPDSFWRDQLRMVYGGQTIAKKARRARKGQPAGINQDRKQRARKSK